MSNPARLSNPELRASYLRVTDGQELNEAYSEAFDALSVPGEKLYFLLEHVVFAPYIDDAKAVWWAERAATLPVLPDDRYVNCKSVLDGVISYMQAWRPTEGVKDYDALALLAPKLEAAATFFEGTPTVPMASIVVQDYLGLIYDKLAHPQPEVQKARESCGALDYKRGQDSDGVIGRAQCLDKTAAAYNKCAELAEKFDDRSLRLWEGFVLFNLARNYLARGNNSEGLETLKGAMSARKEWLKVDTILPKDVRNGLALEYFYAAAFQVDKDPSIDAAVITDLGTAWADTRDLLPSVPLAETIEKILIGVAAKHHLPFASRAHEVKSQTSLPEISKK